MSDSPQTTQDDFATVRLHLAQERHVPQGHGAFTAEQALQRLEEQLEAQREQHDVELDELRMKVVAAEDDARELEDQLAAIQAVVRNRRWGNGAARREIRRILISNPAKRPT